MNSGARLGLQAVVANRLDTLTSWKAVYWAPLILGLMMMGDTWDTGLVGYVLPSLRSEWALSPYLTSIIVSSGFVGQFIGALLMGPLAERFGRIPVFNGAIVFMCIFSLACACAHDPHLFAWVRFAQGLGFGGALPVCASYVNELAPTQTRGRYFSLFQFLMVAGFSISSVVSAIVIPVYGWRAMFVIGAFPVLLTPFVLLTLPESPRWLARFGRTEAASKALVRLGARPLDANIDTTVQEEITRTPVVALFAGGMRTRTIVTCTLWLLTSLAAYSFSTWTPTLYVDVFHLPLAVSLRYAAITGVVYMFNPLIFAFILDKVGRRPTGIFISAVTLLVLIVLALLGRSHAGWSVLLMAIGWTTAGGAFVLLWPYTAEIFPTNMRSTAMGLCSALARAGSTLTPLVVAGVLSKSGSIGLVFAELALAMLIVTILWMFKSTEMARQPLDELKDTRA